MAAEEPGNVSQALIDAAFFGPARQYVRWDTGLHEVFEAAVESLGGAHAAKPAVIRDLMGISLLTTAQVKSHLQKYRIRVVAETGTENATEAQARAAARLVARQKRAITDGSIPPALIRPRLMVPIRGSKQQAAGGSRPGNPGGRKRKSVSSKRQRWSDDDDEEEGDELDEGEEDGEEEDEAGGGARRSSRRRRRRRRVAEYDEGDDDDEDVSLSSGGEGSQGEGRSAGTTTASPLAHLAARGRGSSSLISVEEREPLALAELSRRLTLEGLPIDAATMAGLNSRSLGLVAAAAAAGRSQPADGSMLNVGPVQQHPAVAAAVVAPAQLPVLPDTGAAGALNRQVQLEQALLEQSVWVQKLAAEVQDLRTRQRLGLPPPAPVTEAAAAAVAAAASPFAALSQAAFPGGSGGPDASGVAAAVATAQHGAQANKPSSNLLMCDSTLLRLLSTSLQGTWQRHEASDAAAALLRDTEVQAAVRAVEAAAGLHPGSQQHLLQQQLQQQQAQLQQLQQQDEVAASLLTCDSGMLRMLSDSLRGFWQPQDASDAAAAALLRDTTAQTTVAAAMAAAQASATAKLAPAAPAAGVAPTAFAAAAMQPLAGAPLLHTLQQAGAPLPIAGGARPLAMALPAAGPTGNRQTSLDMFNNSLLALGLTGAGAGAQAPLPAEFLRLCSLPIAADMLPLNFD